MEKLVGKEVVGKEVYEALSPLEKRIMDEMVRVEEKFQPMYAEIIGKSLNGNVKVSDDEIYARLIEVSILESAIGSILDAWREKGHSVTDLIEQKENLVKDSVASISNNKNINIKYVDIEKFVEYYFAVQCELGKFILEETNAA